MNLTPELYTHINKSVKNMKYAIQDVFKSKSTIEDAAKKYGINPKQLQYNMDIWEEELENMSKDSLSLLSLVTHNEISSSMYKSLKDKYPSIKDFENITTTEFCKTLRESHISIKKIIELLDILIKYGILLKDCKSTNDMLHLKEIMSSITT